MGGNDICVMGIDPGLASTGYGIIQKIDSKLVPVAYGVIRTAAHTPQGDRLLEIFDRLTAVIHTYRPRSAGVETLYFAKNTSSALPVAQARGVVLLALARRHICIGEHTPNSIKKAVTGVARADKEQVQEAVKFLLGLTEVPKPNHVADALAAAITQIHQTEFLGDAYV